MNLFRFMPIQLRLWKDADMCTPIPGSPDTITMDKYERTIRHTMDKVAKAQREQNSLSDCMLGIYHPTNCSPYEVSYLPIVVPYQLTSYQLSSYQMSSYQLS
uniref:Uncharacterized protein n=1 Tax=Romanomermis culicivorax TaxID=13658 RepID=A0A915KAQ3_ROMCU